MKKKFTTIAAMLLFTISVIAQNTWTQKADMGGSGKSFCSSFTIGNYGYVAMGMLNNVGSYSNDLWEYNQSTNSWTQKASLPGLARCGAIGFAIGNYGYVGGGIAVTNSNPDFYQWRQATNTWVQKANVPITILVGTVSFSIGLKGYFATGGDGTSNGGNNYCYEYDPSIDAWTQKANFPGVARDAAVGFSIGTLGYVGTGYDEQTNIALQDFYEFNPTANSWTQKANFPGGLRYYATGFSIGPKGYIGTGYDGTNYYNDFYEYDPITDSWTARAAFAGTARAEGTGFSIGSKGYLGTGLDPAFKLDLWEYTPLVSWTPCPTITSVNYGAQTYYTVQIGTQCWFHENLNIGVSVDLNQQINDSIIEKSCYNSLTSECDTFGGIYNWDEAMKYGISTQGICPNGWHIPTKNEWNILMNYLGATAGTQMKVPSTNNPGWDGTNTSYFTAMAGGVGGGSFSLYQGTRETYWSSTQYSVTDAYDYDLSSGNNQLTEANNTKNSGYCIRCILDQITGAQNISVPNSYFSMNPNPSNGKFILNLLSNPHNVNLSIYNVLGEIVYKSEIKNQTTVLDLSTHPNGIYFVRITDGDKVYSEKIIFNN
ncbi:MAG: FISUMP domain-containing protein [Bacteroidota bacterium]